MDTASPQEDGIVNEGDKISLKYDLTALALGLYLHRGWHLSMEDKDIKIMISPWKFPSVDTASPQGMALSMRQISKYDLIGKNSPPVGQHLTGDVLSMGAKSQNYDLLH
ncbi:hypothetical protein AVEN_15087-1 [Araneus ventricosus]|uniref:Uncharacterized protein n=1 Tax=Araneus ventricosus TaxID=182803 RepID=A0A4Y2QDL9_ARAVE|nr:hypothetical protein AVEN_15087-1 [Araneus ventricosus]